MKGEVSCAMRKVQVEVTVDGDINKALYILRNKFNKEGLKNEITKNRFYEKPSETRRRKAMKLQRKYRSS